MSGGGIVVACILWYRLYTSWYWSYISVVPIVSLNIIGLTILTNNFGRSGLQLVLVLSVHKALVIL